MKSVSISKALCALMLAGAMQAGWAQSAATYPNKPVRVIVPYPPGGLIDLVARVVSNALPKYMVQAFVIDNRAGGDTVLGVAAVTKATPDGYTILAHSDALFANHWLKTELPYDTVKDLVLVSSLARTESGLHVSPNLPARTLRELIDFAKANPEKLNVATPSPLNRLSFQRFMNASDTRGRYTLVNYKGGAPAIADLMAGTVHVYISALPSMKPLIKSGKVRVLAVSGGKRDAELPDVPTFEEAGIKGFEPSGPLQNMMLVPAKTPRDIIEKLNAQIGKTLADPEVAASLVKQGSMPFHMTLTDTDRTFQSELGRFGQLVKDAGLKPGDF